MNRTKLLLLISASIFYGTLYSVDSNTILSSISSAVGETQTVTNQIFSVSCQNQRLNIRILDKVCNVVTTIDMIVTDLDSIADILCSKIENLDIELSAFDVEVSGLDELVEQISILGETLCSKLDVINTNVVDVDIDLLSVSDVLCSKIEAIDFSVADVNVNVSGLDELFSEQSALLCSKLDVINTNVVDVDIDLLSVSDVLCSKIEAIDFSVADVNVNVSGLDELFSEQSALLCSKLDVINTNVIDVDEDVQTAQAVLCSKIELVDSQLDVIESKIDRSVLCDPIPITGPTTITSSGFYCVANDITTAAATPAGIISIQANDVTIDLNNHTVESTNTVPTSDVILAIGFSNITIENGTVRAVRTEGGIGGGEGVEIRNGENIVIRNVLSEADNGIFLLFIDTGLIENCEFRSCRNGLLLGNCANIVVDSSNSINALNSGFNLSLTTTCCLRDCKALSTGKDNSTTANAFIFGFSSFNGSGNIFERCIANATQALSTTDFNSVVAGFALRGDEQCSKIINCESANATTSPNGVTIPYGILIEGVLSTSLTVTAVPAIPDAGQLRSLDWSFDEKFVVTGSNTNVRVYSFDHLAETLTQVAGFAREAFSVSWSPDGRYIAVANPDDDALLIFEFDRTTHALTMIFEDIIGSDTRMVRWNLDGRFLAVVTLTPDGSLRVYSFDTVAQSATLVDQVAQGANADSVSWRSDGKFIAVGNDSSLLNVYLFENNTLSFVSSHDFSPGDVRTLDWSFDGKFIAAGTTTGALGILSFESDTLTLLTTDNSASSSLTGLSWSPDGRFVVTGQEDVNATTRVYEFDRGTTTLNLQLQTSTAGSTITTHEVHWSPSGQFIGGASEFQSPTLRIYETLTFPSKNVIKNNVVYCNSGNECPGGIGISGSSIANLIIGNTAYANPLDPPVVTTNYAFVTNVFNELFGQAPSDLQNVSVGGCEPICAPEDLALLSKQIKFKVCLIDSQLDVIESKIDEPNPCAPTPIIGPTTISAQGIYCVGDTISGAITISSSNVALDINGYRITGGVNVTSGFENVAIADGIVDGAGDAINVQGTRNVVIKDLIAQNGTVGIHLTDVIGGLIENCCMTQNVTGLELENSSKITINNCTASCNTNAGFCLLSSTTNCLRDCKALSTGEGNTQLADATIMGFVTTDGFGNIFERCIANSTQALSTTDFNSIVAGFAFRGSESCSKIIDSESANATTSPDGVTIPFGILLEAQFDGLVSVTAVNPNGGGTSDTVNSVDWSPDGKYLAVGGEISGTTDFDLFVYRFDRGTESLTQVDAVNPDGGSTSDTVNSVNWSPDGKYLAVGGNISGITNFDLFI